jgi:crotonobetainyl-CoA:carnitine CoA-transferase CaiB-like acyl-CoA transferase
LGGLTCLVGHEEETPTGMNIRYGDSTVGASAAFAAVAALHHRASAGEGQFIDVSAVETMSSMVGDSLFAFGLTGIESRSDGNFHPEMAPHGCYPCRDGRWISLAVADDTEWRMLCTVLGASALHADPRFGDLAARNANRRELDAALGTVTVVHDAEPLAQAFRAAGIPAFVSQSSLDLVSDGFLWESGVFREVRDGHGEPRPIVGPGWHMTPDEATIERGAPLLGEHNDYVYRELLGLSEGELADLIERKIVE